MGDVIVIAGKGGTGKTTIAALITLLLAKRKRGSVLAVDADPNSNLGSALGISSPGTIADVIDEVAKAPDAIPAGMGKDAFIEYKIHTDIAENDGFDLLVMGRPEGPGCYCYINNVLRNCMSKLVSDYEFVVMDNEAGMEHFSRKTTRSCSELIVVSDETEVGLRSARRIFELIDELNIPARRRFLIVNRATAKQDKIISDSDFSVEKIFKVPYDEELLSLSVKGVSFESLDKSSCAWTAIEKLGDQIWPMN